MPNRKDRVKALAARSRFIVGDLQVHPDRRVVVRNGQDIPLEPRAMEVLVALAEKSGEAMTSSQLQLAVWKTDRHGKNPIDGENAVSKTLSVLRKTLEETQSSRYIETLPGRGYRLKPPVEFPIGYRRLYKTSEKWIHGSPFVGLAAFDAEHAPVFTGRTQATAELLDAMRGQIDNGRRFVLIAGPSGCGKTSLLRAGALPLLAAEGGFGGLRALDVAICDLAASHGGDIMLPLADALSLWTLEARPVFAPQTVESLKNQLTDTPETIAATIAEAFRRFPERGLGAQPHAHLLLVIDHAEVLVTRLHDPQARSAFERTLCALCDAPRTLVAMIVRSDYAPDLAQALPLLNEHKAGGGHLDLLPPKHGEIAEIIRGPARQSSLEFDVDAQSQLLDDALRDAANGQSDALPLLQHTLQLLYERRTENGTLTWEAYREIGGLEGAIAHRAEEVFAALPADAQAALDAVLAKLIVIHSDSDAVTARRTRLDALPDTARALIDAFVAGRLFVSALHDGKPHVGVVHEALLRQWPRAVEWTQENRRLLMAKARLQRAAKRWVEEGRRDDHLLNPGGPLIEAREAQRRFPDEIGEDEISLLRASERMRNRRRMIARIAIGALAMLTIVSSALAITAISANIVAEQNRLKALSLIGYMLVELSDQLRPTASTTAMSSISTHVLEFLEEQPIDKMGPDELINYSRALRTRGEVLSIEEKYDEANALFLRADAMARRAIQMEPESPQATAEAGQTAFWLGNQAYESGKLENSVSEWTRYLRYSERLRSLDADNPDWWQENAYAIANLGYLDQRRGDCASAMKKLIPATELMALAKRRKPGNEWWKYNSIVAGSMISRCKAEAGQIKQASTEYTQLIAELTAIIENHPDAIDWEQQLSSLLHFNAGVSTNLGDINAGERQFLEAADRLKTITKLQPKDPRWKRNLANALSKAADLAYLRRDIDAATSRLRIATSLAEKGLAGKEADKWRRLSATILFKTGRYLANPDSERSMSDAIASLNALMAEDSEDQHTRTALGNALVSRGTWLQERGRSEEARRDWERTRAIMAKIAKDSKDPDVLAPWVNAHLLLERRQDVETLVLALIDSGYAHPEFMDLENRTRGTILQR
ncbi:winged helix-turn-helix domain-containing protein [Lysobacter hankyongensis]|uniref:Winged helix-turn-helix domain-containing protein n=1 Tax=Lysobacter hankyongensis TaxID=1176535 RepID=A0ABP9AI33_9GAMM